jgi:hypothetical protein
MADSISKTTSPADFTILESYKDPKGEEPIKGDFPVYISGAFLCCTDSTGYIEPVPLVLPKN